MNVDLSIDLESSQFNKYLISYIRSRDFSDFELQMKQNKSNSCSQNCLIVPKQTSARLTDRMDYGDSDQVDEHEHDDDTDSLNILVDSDENEEVNNNTYYSSIDQSNNRFRKLGSSNAFNSININSSTNDSSSKFIKLETLNRPSALWDKLSAVLIDLKEEDFEEYLRSSTQIIRMHVKHKLRLDISCYKSLFYCIDPESLKCVFDYGLVDSKESLHIGCLFERNFLFSAIDSPNADEHQYSFEIIMSLAILLYRTKTERNRGVIMQCFSRDLNSFIVSEEYSARTKNYALKCLIKAFVLTGLLNKHKLIDFLSSSSNDSSFSDDNDDGNDSWNNSENDSEADWPSSNEEGESNDEQNRNNAPNVANRIINNHQRVANNNNNEQAALGVDVNNNHRNGLAEQPQQPNMKIAGLLDFPSANKNQFVNMYPFSLKNLCRIKIKHHMPVYTRQTVSKLTLLPAVLQDFILYEDEIDTILKLTRRVND